MASGKYSIGFCDKCGWKYPYKDLSEEPGTKLRVCESCNDGRFSLVSHPQNFPPKKRRENIALKDPSPDPTNESQSGIYVYATTSNNFETEYLRKFYPSITSIRNDTLLYYSPFKYHIVGINASCASGSAEFDLIAGTSTIATSTAITSATGNTSLSGIMVMGDQLKVNFTTVTSAKAVNLQIAIIRTL